MLAKPEAYTNNVLLIDDNDIDNFINERMVRGCRFADVVYVNSSTRSAIEFLRNMASNPNISVKEFPAVIFLDINMPVVDGFVFLYAFDKFPELVKNKTKIIILSSSDNKRDIDKIVNNNHVINFITKPLTETALEEVSLTKK